MKDCRLAPWILLVVLLSYGCHGPVTEDADLQEHPTTTKVQEQPTTTKVEPQPTTTKAEECSWCPAPDPSGTTSDHQPASSQLSLMDQMASEVGGTAFAEISEDQLLSDIRSVCETWKGATSLEDASARASLARSELLGLSESEPGLAAYTRLLHTSAERRCLRDPTA